MLEIESTRKSGTDRWRFGVVKILHPGLPIVANENFLLQVIWINYNRSGS